MKVRLPYLYDNVREEDVVRFIEQWMTVLGLLARYSTNNTGVAQGVDRLYRLLPTVTGRGGTVEFTELHNLLQVNGVPLSIEAQHRDVVAAFAFMLLQHNIRRLTLLPQLNAGEFQALLEYLRQTPEQMQTSIVAMLHEANITGVTAEQYVEMSTGRKVERVVLPAAPASPPSKSGPATPKPQPPKFDPRHAREDTRPPDTLRVMVVVKVGALVLDQAEVSCAEPVAQARPTKGEAGATLFLSAGENQITIHYQNYQITRRIQVQTEGQRVEVDLQSIFDY